MTNEELVERFAAHQRMRGFSPRTIDRRTWSLRKLATFTGGSPLLDVGRDDLEDWLGTYTGVQTRYSMRADVRQFFRWAINRDLHEVNPTDRIESPRLRKHAATPLSRAQLDRALDAADVETRTMLLLGAFAGLRCSEIARLRFDDVRPEDGALVVRGGKGGKDRVIPLAPRLAAQLDALYASRQSTSAQAARERAAVQRGRIGGNTSLGEYLEHWREHAVHLTALTPLAQRNYRSIIRCHLVPAVGHLKLSQVDQATNGRLVEWMTTNGSSDGTIRMARTVLVRALEPIRNGDALDLAPGDHERHGPIIGTDGQAVGHRVRTLFRSLGIQARPHDLRHTFGTEAARVSNGNIVLVAQLMGHESIQTTQRYVGWTPAGADTVAAMFGAGAS